MNTFKRIDQKKKTRPMFVISAAAAAVALLATVGLVAGVADADRPTLPPAVATSDTSFDRAEYNRHLSLLQEPSDGLQTAERARFERLLNNVDPTVEDGFDRVEKARHQRLDGG